MNPRTLPHGTPLTDGALFDALHDMFGIGTYDEDRDGPWWRWRISQVARVKQSRIKHDCAIPDLYVTALYCKATSQTVEGVTWLYRHIHHAWAWWDGQATPDTADLNFADAVRIESANRDTTWLQRLLRAAPEFRQEVLQQWEHERWTIPNQE